MYAHFAFTAQLAEPLLCFLRPQAKATPPLALFTSAVISSLLCFAFKGSRLFFFFNPPRTAAFPFSDAIFPAIAEYNSLGFSLSVLSSAIGIDKGSLARC